MDFKMTLKPANKIVTALLVILISVNLMGCGAATPIPTATSTNTATVVPTKTHTPTATITSTPEPSPTATIPAVPTISVNTQSAFALSNECRMVVDGLYNLKKDLGLPDHFTEENPFRRNSDFNPNSYFRVLTHLKLISGYKLDYIYFHDELGGLPLVYARKSSSAPVQSYAELLKSFGEDITDERSYGELKHRYDYLEKIQIDKTPESYFEFVTIAFLGDQFYLLWHGLYNDEKILCDSSDQKYFDTELGGMKIEFPQDVKDRIEKIDFSPVVIVGEKDVTVRFVTFTKWGGFFENVYVMDKDDPMKLLDMKFNPIIKYDCGINF
ncbi:MAG: hypothetical protein HGA53_06370 [Anaerolineaceae bacterium]|nr:hypothetical protein [Anaerolineaceae bacterium]